MSRDIIPALIFVCAVQSGLKRGLNMLNEAKIKIMTKAAVFEEKQKKKALHINQYYKFDYVTYHIIKCVLGATVCYGLFVLMWVLYDAERLLTEFSVDRLFQLGEMVLLGYVAFALLYGIIAGLIYSARYDQAMKKMRPYMTNLKRLQKYYSKEGKDQTL